jgi:hypothetical protein
MVTVNTLRIGNWVSNGEKYYTVDINMLYDIATNENFPIEPIPLTPEILEACGFKKWDSVDNRFNHAEPNFDIEFENALYHRIIWESREEVYEPFDTPFQYLHELQNKFYFATGKEIEIKQLTTV